jgi:hypothetical protein
MDIDIGKDSFYVVGRDRRGAIVLRQKWSFASFVRVRAMSGYPPKLTVKGNRQANLQHHSSLR